MALREILAVFGVEFDAKALEHGNRAIDASVKNLGHLAEAVLGAFAFEKVKQFTEELVHQGVALKQQADRLNTTTDELQALGFAAEHVGLETESLDAIFSRLAGAAFRAEDGGKGVAATLKDLGVEMKASGGQLKPATQLFEEVGIALGQMSDRTKAAGIATQLFGRGANAQKVMQLFKGGKEAIEEYKKKFEELGGAFSEEFIAAAEKVHEEQIALNTAWTSAKVRIAGVLLPAFKTLTEGLTKVVGWFSSVTKNTNFTQAAFILAGSAATVSALKIIQAYGPVLKTFGKWTAIILLAILALDDLITFLEGGDSVIGRVLDSAFGKGTSEKVRGFINDVKKAWHGFWDDLKNKPLEFESDIKLAITQAGKDIESIAYVGPILRTVFDFGILGIDALTGGWENFKAKLDAGAAAIGNGLESIWTEIKFAVLLQIAEMSDAFDNFVAKVTHPIDVALNAVGLGGPEKPKAPGTSAAKSIESLRFAERERLGKEALDIRNRINRPGSPGAGSNVTVHSPVTVNVAPGTPTSQRRAVGEAAQRGAKGAHRAAGAALVKHGSKE